MFGNQADLVHSSSNEDESGISLLDAKDPQLCIVSEPKSSPYRVWKVTVAVVAVVRTTPTVCAHVLQDLCI